MIQLATISIIQALQKVTYQYNLTVHRLPNIIPSSPSVVSPSVSCSYCKSEIKDPPPPLIIQPRPWSGS